MSVRRRSLVPLIVGIIILTPFALAWYGSSPQPKAPLDKSAKITYGNSGTNAPTSVELLWEEIAMHVTTKTLVAAVAVLQASVAVGQEHKPTPLQEITVTAPAATATDKPGWDSAHYARFKDIWINCPARVFEPGTYQETAKSFNEDSKRYQRIIKSCKKHEAHIPKRAWPPSVATARPKMDRWFARQCTGPDQQSCQWVQTR